MVLSAQPAAVANRQRIPAGNATLSEFTIIIGSRTEIFKLKALFRCPSPYFVTQVTYRQNHGNRARPVFLNSRPLPEGGML